MLRHGGDPALSRWYTVGAAPARATPHPYGSFVADGCAGDSARRCRNYRVRTNSFVCTVCCLRGTAGTCPHPTVFISIYRGGV